jgi:membrane-bound lytic murein transglycosylase D
MVVNSETRLSCAFVTLLVGIVFPLSSQQINFQTALLPATPRVVAPAETHAKKEALEAHQLATQIEQRRRDSEVLVRRAGERFQRGKRAFQAKDAHLARQEFDSAIDAMLAAGETTRDRAAWEQKMDEMVDAIHRYDLAGLGAGDRGEEPGFEKAPLEDILELTFPTDPKLKLQVREQLMATVSQLPLTVNDQVLGYMRYFSMPRGRATMIAGLRRAGRYRPLIRRILDEEGLPQELIHLAQAESGFLPRAVSRKAAGGMWQFVRFRGREYGLVQDQLIDERYDPEKATRAAARHLRDLYRQFGDWYLAIAAYNCGPGAVDKAVQRSGYADFWELRARRLLPLETTNYVPIILAMTIMSKNDAAYGLTDVVPEQPLEYDSIEIDAPTHLALVGDLTESPVSELSALNPALLKQIAPAGYLLRVPKGTGTSLAATLQMVPAERRASWRMHTVQSGDTLAGIGQRYGANPGTIMAANQLQAMEPVAGDQLVIPAVERKAPAKATRISRSRSAAASRASSRGKSPAVRRAAAKTPARKSPRVLTRTASAARPRSTF